MATPPQSFPIPAAALQAMRNDYRKASLTEADVNADAIRQFGRWFSEALSAEVPEANAMTVATASADGAPSARVLLLKGFDDSGFTFFTNYDSRKGQELAENPRAALVFFWQPLERQVRIEGSVERVSREESKMYFETRPRNSRIGAWSSRQSRQIASREALEAQERSLHAVYPEHIPLPDFWGGYRLMPTSIEFWQGRASRLHDRLRYTRRGDAWIIERLSP